VLLFNLRTDIGERDDLTAARQDLIKPMRALIAEWEKDVDAEAAAKKQ